MGGLIIYNMCYVFERDAILLCFYEFIEKFACNTNWRPTHSFFPYNIHERILTNIKTKN